MNTHARLTTAAAGLLVLLGSFAVHAQHDNLRARIPFAFTAGDTAFTPGLYTVGRTGSSQGVVVIRNQQRGAMLLTQRGSRSTSRDRPRFVFSKYGNQYFLREVWFLGNSGLAFAETKQERAAATETRRAASLVSTITIDAAID